MPAEVIVTIDAEGNATVKAQGVAGSGCRALTAGIEAALGVVTADRPTEEMHRQASQQAKAGAG